VGVQHAMLHEFQVVQHTLTVVQHKLMAVQRKLMAAQRKLMVVQHKLMVVQHKLMAVQHKLVVQHKLTVVLRKLMVVLHTLMVAARPQTLKASLLWCHRDAAPRRILDGGQSLDEDLQGARMQAELPPCDGEVRKFLENALRACAL
jgi:hypothetical protein